jgi:NADH:ubiquinone oxidoreductase subunit 5 (subunit L)/multisubunit Na+/H+ antiporter MnhA subunit
LRAAAFIGAMGKSAQLFLHIGFRMMEGLTPVSF